MNPDLPGPLPGSPTSRSKRLRAWFARTADALPDSLPALASWLPLAAAICAAPGVALIPLVAGGVGFLRTNQLPTPDRAIAGVLVLVVAVLVALPYRRALRRRASGEALDVAARRVNRWFSPLLFLPVLVWMIPKGGEVERPLLELALVAAMAAWTGVLAYGVRPGAASLSARAPIASAAVLGLLYVAVIGFYALRHHRALGTGVYDLGIYDSVVWNGAHGRLLATSVLPAGTHLAGHFDPVLVLLAPLYWIAPGAETLLVFQTVWLALGAAPLWLLARDALQRPWAATAVVAAYLLHPALHGANLFDFHSITLSIPLLIAAVWLLRSGRLRAYAVVVGVLLLVREDVSLMLAFLGVWAALGGRPRAGMATLAAAAIWFVAVRVLVLGGGVLNEGAGPDAHSFAYFYEALIPQPAEGSSGVPLSLLVNPAFAVAHALSADKMRYLAVMFVPLAFLPLLAPRAGWLLFFGLASTLLASREAVFSPYYQYVTTLLPFAVVLAPLGLARLRDGEAVRRAGLDPDRLVRASTVALVVAAVLTTVEFGAIVSNDAFRAGSRRLKRRWSPEVAQRYEAVREAVEQIGPEASVSATRNVLAHASARAEIAEFPRPEGAEFLLLQADDLDPRQRARLRALERAGAYRVVERRGSIELWRRVPGVPLPPLAGRPP